MESGNLARQIIDDERGIAECPPLPDGSGEVETLLRKHSIYYFRKLRDEGFVRVEYDEIFGRLGVAYTEIIMGGTWDDNRGTKFNTYLLNAFFHKMCDYRTEMMKANGCNND